ncbi:MAG: IPT/TIG domain-containing protein [Candidatus Neomarinimicrobiota bacterium]
MKQLSAERNVTWILSLFVISIFSACEEPEYPESIWEGDDVGEAYPSISLVQPEDGSLAGVGEVTIIGENFSADSADNIVFFDGSLATILSASEMELLVRAPDLSGDSLTIKVAVTGAFEFAEYHPYKLEPAVTEYGAFGEFDDIYAMAMDTDENLYISIYARTITMVDSTEEKSEYASWGGPPLILAGMKMGPDGYLYFAANRTQLYRINPDDGSRETFAVFEEKVLDLDFDSDLNLYAAGKEGRVFLTTPEGDTATVAQYDTEIEFNCVRVFGDHVYLTGESPTQKAIWRNEIEDGGTLGPGELVFDWDEFAGDLGPSIQAITFAEDGTLFIGSNREEALYALEPPYSESTPEPLYPQVLVPPASWLSWGNGKYLYVNRHSDDTAQRRVLKVNMKQEGAPYYGRQ